MQVKGLSVALNTFNLQTCGFFYAVKLCQWRALEIGFLNLMEQQFIDLELKKLMNVSFFVLNEDFSE